MIEAAQLAGLNQTVQGTWKQSSNEGAPPGHDIVTNPTYTCPQHGFTLPRRQLITLCPDKMYQISLPVGRNRIIGLLAPADTAMHQTTTAQGILLKSAMLLTASPGCLRRLHEADPGAVEWLSRRLYETVRMLQTNNMNTLIWANISNYRIVDIS